MKKQKLLNRNTFTFLFLLLLVVLSTACSNKPEPAYLTVSAPSSEALQKATQSHKFDNSELGLSQFILSVHTINGKRIRSVNLLTAADDVKLEVPTGIELIVSGEAFREDVLSYKGQVGVQALRPGQSSSVSLVLYDVNNAETELQIDLGLNNAPANGLSKGLTFSRDNQYVLFLSSADNLTDNDDNQSGDLYLKKFVTDEVINLNSDELGNVGDTGVIQEVSSADISESGLYVVFSSTASNLVLGDTNNVEDVFLKNTLTGETRRISIDISGNQVFQSSYDPQISDDGSIITFKSDAILEIEDSSGGLYEYNRLLNQIQRLTGFIDNYVLSGDGQWLAYQHLVSSENGQSVQLVVQEIATGDQTIIQESDNHFIFNLSQNGQFLVFVPQDRTLTVPADTELLGAPNENLGKPLSPRAVSDDQIAQIFIYSRASNQSRDVSENLFGSNFSDKLTQNNLPAISNDGRYLAFSHNNTVHVFNAFNNNLAEVAEGIDPFLSRDGRKIGFTRDQNLYLIDNPLFVASTSAAAKAQAPTDVIINAGIGQVSLSWQLVEDANYYRIYQSNVADIAAGIDSGELIPHILETQDNQIIITENLDNGANVYFVVAAINEQGESAFSQEISTTIFNPENEGSFDSPISVNNGLHQGMVGTGRSYYSLNSPTQYDYYFIRLLNSSSPVNFDASAINFDSTNGCLQESNSCLVDMFNSEIPSNTVYVSVDGSDTEQGAIYDLDFTPLVNRDFNLNVDLNIIGFGNTGDITGTLISGSQFLPETTYTFFFNPESLGSSHVAVSSLKLPNETCDLNGSDESAQYACEFTTDVNGELFLKFEALANAEDMVLQARIIEVEQLSFSPDSISLDLASDFERYFKVTVPSGLNYAAILENENANRAVPADFAIYENHWRNRKCSGTLRALIGFVNCDISLDDINSFYIHVRDAGFDEIGADIQFTLIPQTTPDQTAPLIRSVNSIAEYQSPTIDSRIDINFNEAISAASITPGAINLSDRSGEAPISVPFTASVDGAVVTLTPDNVLEFGTTYGIEVTSSITDLAGNSLLNLPLNIISTWAPNNEGNLEIPRNISGTTYDGMVATGSSFYRLSPIQGDYYFIELLDKSGPVTLSASGYGFNDQGSGCELIETSCIADTVESFELSIEVDGSQTQNGAVFSMQYLPLQGTFFSTNPAARIITSLANDNSMQRVLLTGSGLNSNLPYALKFTNLGNAVFDVQSLYDLTNICTVDGSQQNGEFICEFATDSLGNIPLNIIASSNIDQLDIIVQPIPIVELNYNNLPIIPDFSDSADIVLKISGLQTNTSYSATTVLQNGIRVDLKGYENNWQNLVCDVAVSVIPDQRANLCILNTDDAGNINLSLNQSQGDSLDPVVIAFSPATLEQKNMSEFSSIAINTLGSFHRYEISGFTPDTFYSITLESPQPSGAVIATYTSQWQDLTCINGHIIELVDVTALTCEAKSDANGSINFQLVSGLRPINGEIATVIAEIFYTPLISETIGNEQLNGKQLTPAYYANAVGVTPGMPYSVNILNINVDSETSTPYPPKPNIQILDENWSNRSCFNFYSNLTQRMGCYIVPEGDSFNIKLSDYIGLSTNFTQPSPTTASISVSPITTTPLNMVDMPTGGFSDPDTLFAGIGFKLFPLSGLVANASYIIEIRGIEGSLSIPLKFKVFSDNELKNLVCESFTIPDSLDQDCLIDLIPETIYILVDGIDTNSSESFVLNIYRNDLQ